MGQHSQFWGKKHEWAVPWISRLSRLPSPCLSFIETRHRSQPNYNYVDFSGPSGTSHLAGGPSRCTRRNRVFLKLDWNQGPTIDDKARKLTYFAVKTLPTIDNKARKLTFFVVGNMLTNWGRMITFNIKSTFLAMKPVKNAIGHWSKAKNTRLHFKMWWELDFDCDTI